MRTVVLGLAMAVAGCANGGGGAESPAAQVPGTRCDATALAEWVGKPAASLDDATAQARSGATIIRRHGVNDPVTKDYRVERLNIVTDDGGRIVRTTCG